MFILASVRDSIPDRRRTRDQGAEAAAREEASAARGRKVLVLNHFAAPRESPGGTRHVELFDRISGWESRIVASNRNHFTGEKTRSRENYRVVWSLPYRGNGVTRILNWLSYSAGAFVTGAATRGVTVVYASSPHLLTGLVGVALAALKRVPFVLEIRDVWPQVFVDMGALKERSFLYQALCRLERLLYRRAKLVATLSAGLREVVIERGADPHRVRVVSNGADPDDFVAPAPREELRARYGLSGLVVVYAGAHGPANGLDLVLDAASELRDELPEVSFVLVGDGPSKKSLLERAAREGLTNVRFLDPVPKSEMPALLGAADVGLHVLADVPVFHRGSTPNKLFDYMASGTPVITNVPGEAEKYMAASGGGLGVGSRDLASGIREMASAGSDRRSEWGAAGRDYVAAFFSRTAIARDLESLLEEALEA